MKVSPILFVVCISVFGIVNATYLGVRRVRSHGLRFGYPKSTMEQSNSMRSLLTQYSPPVPRSSLPETPKPSCCKPVYGEPQIDVAPEQSLSRPFAYKTDDYLIFDSFRNRPLRFFDPEEWVTFYPSYPFPRELDIPYGWSIYNPVTVQAPPPVVVQDLRTHQYNGYYYACPNNVNPYIYSWYYNNDYVNKCKWIWYQF